VKALLCALGGTLLFLSCASFDIWPLAYVGIVPLLWVVLDEKCTRPFLYGWICGLLANGGGFYWIDYMLRRFGHMPMIASLPLFLLLVAYQAITFGFFAVAVRRLRDVTKLPVVLLAPIVMTALELAVPFLFPWYLAITQAWVRPIIQIADITGPLGVTFLIVMVNGAIYEALAAWRAKSPIPWKRVGAAATVVVLCLGYGLIRIHQVEARRAAAPHVKVGVVQANVGITEKFVPGLREAQLGLHQQLSQKLAADGAELIVWPESSYPYAFDRRATHDYHDIRQVQRGHNTPMLIGAITAGDDAPYPYNSAMMLDEHGEITGKFDKNFLLVFGEYIPFYEHLQWVRKYVPEASNFARGDGVTVFPFRDWKIGPMICYEDIIPSFGRRLAAQHPNLLVNITNDAWFGATSEPYEHLALAVYRAVENRLDLVRAVNTGVSAFVDATGKVRKIGPAVDPEVNRDAKPQALLDEVAMVDAGGLYATVGDTFGVLNLLAFAGLGIWARRRSGKAVRWRAVGIGAGALAVAILVGGLVAGGASQIGVVFEILAHRPTPPGDTSRFALGGWLLLATLLGAAAMGTLVTRLESRDQPRQPRLEVSIAAVFLVLAPSLFGRIEGETAALVFTSLGAMAFALLGVRFGKWLGAKPAAEKIEEAPAPTEKPRKKKSRKR
jgi:apolipoprotein N-acyltransferase